MEAGVALIKLYTSVAGGRWKICLRILEGLLIYLQKIYYQLSAEFCYMSYLLKESCFLGTINLINQVAANITEAILQALSCLSTVSCSNVSKVTGKEFYCLVLHLYK